MKFVKRFMKTAIQKTHEKSPVFLAIMLEVDFPTKPPIWRWGMLEWCYVMMKGVDVCTFPIASSRPRVEAKPWLGGNQEEKILYWAILVKISPRARTMRPKIMNLYERTVVAEATKMEPMV